MKQRRIAPLFAGAIGIVILGLLVVLAVAKPSTDESASSPLLGKPAPAVKSTVIGAGTFDLSRRKGSWVAFNFFNSTCVPCRQEHKELVAFWTDQKTSDDPVELYSIINDDSDGAVKAFFDTNGGGWDKVRDDDGAISVAFGVAKVPETWIIDPNGFVRLRILGALTNSFLTTRMNELKKQFASE
jgi:cytochrome c biogenesis protein CcmG/thiol:disulfide interchange protein DsbE